MYAVVHYHNSRKEQDFEIKMVTDDINYAKKLAFHHAEEDLVNLDNNSNSIMFRITTNIIDL